MRKMMLIAGAVALLAAPAFADIATELSTAQTHAGMAASATDIAMTHKHLQHAVNCLEGPMGKDFDAAAGNPCGKAGMGAIVDSTDAAQKAKLQSIADSAKMGVGNPDLAASQASAKSTADAIASASK
jgi:hypothetical protein